MTTSGSTSLTDTSSFTFRLPDPGEGLVSAELLEWAVEEGQEVAADQHILTVETAKASVEISSPVSGRVLSLVAQVGQVVSVGAALVQLEVSGTDHLGVTHLVGRVTEAPETPTVALRPKPTTSAAKATPAVRRLARGLGLSLQAVRGTGPGGQITVEDVEIAAAQSNETE